MESKERKKLEQQFNALMAKAKVGDVICCYANGTIKTTFKVKTYYEIDEKQPYNWFNSIMFLKSYVYHDNVTIEFKIADN